MFISCGFAFPPTLSVFLDRRHEESLSGGWPARGESEPPTAAITSLARAQSSCQVNYGMISYRQEKILQFPLPISCRQEFHFWEVPKRGQHVRGFARSVAQAGFLARARCAGRPFILNLPSRIAGEKVPVSSRGGGVVGSVVIHGRSPRWCNPPALRTASSRVGSAPMPVAAGRHIERTPISQGATSGFSEERYFLTTVGKSQRAF